MFICSVTLTKEKIALLLALILIILLVSGVFITFLEEDSLLTDKGRLLFLTRCGLSPDSTLVSTQSFKIPKELDSFFNEYEALQQKQGLSLLPYRKKTVKKYTYLVSKETEEPIYANLFIKRGKLVACDLTCPDFQKGWQKPLLPEKISMEESVR